MNEGYTDLANAIIEQAVKDYIRALKILKKRPWSKLAQITIHEVEQFFRSDWYLQLTDLDPEMLIQSLTRRCPHDSKEYLTRLCHINQRLNIMSEQINSLRNSAERITLSLSNIPKANNHGISGGGSCCKNSGLGDNMKNMLRR